MIQVENLVKQYGDFVAVDHLSFTVKEGEILGFLGPNGAGKSTTMNMITGYISATQGDVIINGHNIYEEPELAKKSIGYLPEIPPVYPDMRVLEYLKFVAELKGVERGKRNEEVASVMEKVRITHMKEKLIKHLSKGYRQRVGLAQALIGNPPVIILDEPTVGLDPAQIIDMRELIRNLAKDHTVILSSHILFEVNAICDEILIINHGKKVVLDKPGTIIEQIGGTAGQEIVVAVEEAVVRPILEQIDGVERVQLLPDAKEENEQNGELTFQVIEQNGRDIRAALFFACAKANIAILKMTPMTRSLEEVFIEMTSEEGMANAGNL